MALKTQFTSYSANCKPRFAGGASRSGVSVIANRVFGAPRSRSLKTPGLGDLFPVAQQKGALPLSRRRIRCAPIVGRARLPYSASPLRSTPSTAWGRRALATRHLPWLGELWVTGPVVAFPPRGYPIGICIGPIFWFRLYMIQSDPTIRRKTIKTPKASARTLFTLSGPVVMCRKKTRCTPI